MINYCCTKSKFDYKIICKLSTKHILIIMIIHHNNNNNNNDDDLGGIRSNSRTCGFSKLPICQFT